MTVALRHPTARVSHADPVAVPVAVRREARRLGWATREVHHHHSFKEATEEEEEGITEETGHRREQTDRK